MFFNISDLKIVFMVMPDVKSEVSNGFYGNEQSNPNEEDETENHVNVECLLCR